jgi:hypothetical protein
MTPKQFIPIQLGLILLCAGAAWFPIQSSYGQTASILVSVGIALSGISGIIAFLITFSGVKKRVQAFMNYLMGGMLAKLFIGIITVSVVAIKAGDYAMLFVLSYFFAYILFTAFEVFALMRNLRPILKEREHNANEETGDK